MGQCYNTIHSELWADDASADEDTDEWNAFGISKKTVHSKGVLRSTKNHGFSCPEFKPSEEVKARKTQYRFGSRNLNVIPPRTTPKVPDVVPAELELLYAHGFNGRFLSCRQNLYLSHDESQLLYFIASVGVVFDFKKNEQKFFKKHNDDITSICIAPKSMNKSWAATAQKDAKDLYSDQKGKDLPKIWIWNYDTMESIKLIDSVCWGKIEKVQWSEHSNILWALCGDDVHTLKGYAADKGFANMFSGETVRDTIYGFTISPFGATEGIDELIIFGKRSFRHVVIGQNVKKCTVSIRKFEPKGEVSFGSAVWMERGLYAVGAQSGRIYLCRNDEALKMVKGHDKAVGDLCFIRNENRMISVGYDQEIKFWKWNGEDIALRTEKEPLTVDEDISLSPRVMVLHQGTGDLFVGTKNNEIIQILNTGDSKVILNGHHGEAWALCVHPKALLFATGGYDTYIRIWSAQKREMVSSFKLPVVEGRKKRSRHKHKNFVCCGSWSSDGKLLAFGTMDSHLFLMQWDGLQSALSLKQVIHIPRRSRRAPIEPVSNMRFSPNADILGVTHYNGRMYLFDVNHTENGEVSLHQWHATMEHIAAPIQLQFSSPTDGTPEVIKTFTRDYEVCHWILNRTKRDCKFCPWIPAPEDIEWTADPLIAGWSVQGLYRQNEGWDGTDLNDIAVTKDGKIAISGDDRATIRVTNYPALRQEPSTAYTNHAEFVVAVKLLADDSQLISCGGADRAVFQWKLHKNYEHKAIEIEEESFAPKQEMKMDSEEIREENVDQDSGPELQLEPGSKLKPEPETEMISQLRPIPVLEPELEPEPVEPEPVVEPVRESSASTSDEDEFPQFNEQWLRKHKLAEYWPLFEAEGYDDFEVISTLSDADLEELGISKGGHRKKLLLRIQRATK